MKRLLCLVLTLALLLSGCSLETFRDMFRTDFVQDLFPSGSFSEFVYTRPDMDTHDRVLAESIALIESSSDLDAVIRAIYDYYEQYDLVSAAESLSYIHYCRDPEDLYWSAEYEYCASVIAQIDAGLESLYCALAQSPLREELEGEDYFGADYFDAYENGGVWDETLLAWSEEEALLVEQYYSLSAEAAEADITSDSYYADYALPLAELLVKLVKLRQEQADYLGYPGVAEMTYEWYHYRDYTPSQVEAYLLEIRDMMTPLYNEILDSDVWDAGYAPCNEKLTFSYVKTAATAMGGNIADAFSHMATHGLYDIEASSTKVDISFETYILHYYAPYVFLCPYNMAMDKLTFAHEFGHFVNDWLCDPSYAGTDIAEIHSQGMEYLSLFYTDSGKALERYKLADCLSIYVDQAAYALFEHRLYQLKGDELTAENVIALFGQVCTEFGWDEEDFYDWGFTQIPHFYSEPMYIISYVVSNDVAFQVYQLEAEETGAGLAVYNRLLTSQETYLLSFVEDYGLESPFAPGRVEAVKNVLEQALKKAE